MPPSQPCPPGTVALDAEGLSPSYPSEVEVAHPLLGVVSDGK